MAPRRVRRTIALLSLTAILVAASMQLPGAAPLNQVRRNGSLRLCANPAAPPFSNRADKDRPGFQVELAEALAREMGLALTLVWTRGLGANKAGSCDASLDAIALPPRYQHEGRIGPLRPADLPVRFSKPYAAGGVFLVVRSGSPARRFDDLGAEKIGAVVGSVEHEALARRGLNISAFAFQEDIVAAVDNGELGAGAAGAPFIGWYRRQHPQAKLMIPEGYEPEPEFRWNVAVGLWRTDDAMVEAMNAAIDRVSEKQIPDRLYAKYGVTYHPPYPTLAPGER
jgi:ABC-type amino acid transport substrate-binding protein